MKQTSETDCNCSGWTARAVGLMGCLIMLGALFLGAGPAGAAGCAQDVLPVGSQLQCTAKEVTPSVLDVVVTDDGRTSRLDTVSFVMTVAFDTNADRTGPALPQPRRPV
jgi:hypothetical protein